MLHGCRRGLKMFLEFIYDKYKVSLKRLKKYRKIFNSAIEKSINLQKEELHSKDEAKLFVDTINVMRASNKGFTFRNTRG